MTRRTTIVYLALALAFTGVLAWQAIDHKRTRQAARSALVHRAEDITTTLGVVIRSQRRMGGIVSPSRLESALKELVKADELNAVALFNVLGEVVASAGDPIDFELLGHLKRGERWRGNTLTLANLVDLGAGVAADQAAGRPTIVVELPDLPPRGRGDWSFGRRPREGQATSPDAQRVSPGEAAETAARPPPPPFGRFREEARNPEEYRALLEKQGLHGFILVMSTGALNSALRRDLWLRGLIASLAGLASLGLGLAWRNLEKTSDLRLRLARTSQLNTHLKELNLAAAGLAHETRNPLNLIRGLAQLISKGTDGSVETRRQSEEITTEVDRVTAQLNEFLHYSRPREVRRTFVPLSSVISDVVRALQSDLEDKEIDLERLEENLTVEADEPMLRQVLFNLLINAIQAAPQQGRIQVVSGQDNQGVYFQISDNGPGVPPEHRHEIFRPYFTTNHNGTGLGLAVVNQIVLAHGWDIVCTENPPKRGAVFRISRVTRAPGSP